jgi:hypothetical protein
MQITRIALRTFLPTFIVLLLSPSFSSPQTEAPKKLTWKSVQFAIVRFNDQAPTSWNIYHGERKGILLVRLWKRYMLVRIADEEVYDLDPQKITVHGDSVDWSPADVPDKPVEIVEWKERNVGSMQRVTFRFGSKGHVLELQIPLALNGDPMY